jgi:hypothetical protein
MIVYNDIEEFISLKPAHYRFLKTINLTRTISKEGCGRFDVDIILSKVSENTVEDLRVRCINSFDIKIGDIESMFGFHIEIEDIRSRQLEGGKYRIVEQEENAFSFYCDEFFAELINP